MRRVDSTQGSPFAPAKPERFVPDADRIAITPGTLPRARRLQVLDSNQRVITGMSHRPHFKLTASAINRNQMAEVSFTLSQRPTRARRRSGEHDSMHWWSLVPPRQ